VTPKNFNKKDGDLFLVLEGGVGGTIFAVRACTMMAFSHQGKFEDRLRSSSSKKFPLHSFFFHVPRNQSGLKSYLYGERPFILYEEVTVWTIL
jgi:hypothetical protein